MHHYLTIAAVSELIRTRALSPVELTNQMLERVDALEGSLETYVTITRDRALNQAREAEKAILAGNWKGPLHGVPIAYKDIIYTDFAPTTAGSLVHRDFQPSYSATVVNRLEEAGAVTLGKVKTTEHAYGAHHPEIPAPKNPWNPEFWTGTSSSGSGVSVAAGVAFAALGTDTGGSIRYPATCNGITGIKPTWGRVSRYGVFALAGSLDHIGPMTRSAVDAGIVLSAMAGLDHNDPTSRLEAVEDYARFGDLPMSGLRIGIDWNYVTEEVDASIVAGLRAAAVVFESLGATIVEVKVLMWREANFDWMALCSSETALAHADNYPREKEKYGPVLSRLIEKGRAVSGVEVAKAHHTRLAFSAKLAAVFAGVDLLLLPATLWEVPSLARWDAIINGIDPTFDRFTGPFNMSGSPTITLPSGFDENGMPISIQLVAPHLQEGLLVQAGAAFQRATDWHTRHPNI